MKKEEIRELWASYLAGKRLTPEEERDILEAVRADETLRTEILGDAELDGLLSAAARNKKDAEVFAQSVSDCVRADSDATRFIKQVERRVSASSSSRLRRVNPRTGSGWKIFFAAAGILAAAVALWLFIKGYSDRSGEGGVVKNVPGPKVQDNPPKDSPRPEDQPKKIQNPEPKKDEERKPPEEQGPTKTPNEEKPNPEEKPKEPPREEKKPDESKPLPETREAVATITEAQGATLRDRSGEAPAAKGQGLTAGQGLRTAGRGGFAEVKFADGTKVRLTGDSVAQEIVEGKDKHGKRIVLAEGAVRAEVSKQPKDQPMIFATPHGECRVLGTSFRLAVEGGSTWVEVKEGKVELKRKSDGKSVEVDGGSLAVIGQGVEFKPKKSDDSNLVPRLDLRLWLKADSIAPSSGGSKLAKWEDRSGTSTVVKQEQEREQPTFLLDAINGRPAVSFDGSQSCLKFALQLNAPSEMTILLVSRCTRDRTSEADGNGGYAAFYLGGKEDTSNAVLLSPYQSNVEFRWGTKASEAAPRFKRPLSLGENPTLTVVRRRGSQESLYVNGSLVLTQAAKTGAIRECPSSGILGAGADKSGRDACFQGEIAEILVFTRALSDAELGHVMEYLGNKYFPALGLPLRGKK